MLLLLLLVACGGGAVVDKPAPVIAPTCASAAATMGDMIAMDISRPSDEAVNELIGLIESRCAKDRWSAAAVKCLSEMRTVADADLCGTQLTPAQQKALVDDLPASTARSAKPPGGNPDVAEPSAP